MVLEGVLYGPVMVKNLCLVAVGCDCFLTLYYMLNLCHLCHC